MKEFTKETYHHGGFYHVKHRIYAITNPLTGDPFYVGKTIKPLSDRLHGHIKAANGQYEKFSNELKDSHIREIIEKGLRPKMIQLQVITPVSRIEYLEISEIEIEWMKKLKEQGHNIMNIIGLRIPQLNAKYLIYKEQLQSGSVETKYYFSGYDINGLELYHKERIISDGGLWIGERIPIAKTYNPFENDRFLKKLGLA